MKHLLIIIVLQLLTACDKKEDNRLTLEEFEKQKVEQGWKKFDNGRIQGLAPETWTFKQKDSTLIWFPLDYKKDIFFVAVNYNLDDVKSSSNYIHEIFNQVSSKDSTFNYKLNKIVFHNNQYVYILKLYLPKNTFFIAVYENDNQIYDLTYKATNEHAQTEKDYKVFFDLILSFKVNDRRLFDSENLFVAADQTLQISDI